ncbi:hypothetical protein ES332_D03G115600v1 [Gossypium tomentosum]|uniref:Transmembrane protein n=1 Tax=Gossypium tomentosum TaxID=34277 RepID=A0A5D2LNN8_GOSTO|nr:hypothetical protein ES332_D03G115600v1 [Gossypium tomentosum]
MKERRGKWRHHRRFSTKLEESRTTRCDSFSVALRVTSSDLTLSNLLTNQQSLLPFVSLENIRDLILLFCLFICVCFILLCSLLRSLSLLFLFHFSSLFSNFGCYLFHIDF